MIDKDLHDYLIKVLQSFLTVAKAEDAEYFNEISEDEIHVIYASPDMFASRKGKRIVQNDKNFLVKSLFAPYQYSLYVTHSFPLVKSTYSMHPETPMVYLDAFLVDNSIPENQRVYLLLGNNSDNTIVIKSYDRLPNGQVIGVSTLNLTDLDYSEKDMVKYANNFISAVCVTVSKCKLNKVKSPINLEVAEL